MPNSQLSALRTADWDQMVDINIKGVLNGVAAVLPTFVAQKSGHVVATSSVAGLKAYPTVGVYCGTKWFVRGFMEALRLESVMEQTNIRPTTVYPAAIKAELLETITDKNISAAAKAMYDKVGISPDRIADVVAYVIDAPADTTICDLTVGPVLESW